MCTEGQVDSTAFLDCIMVLLNNCWNFLTYSSFIVINCIFEGDLLSTFLRCLPIDLPDVPMYMHVFILLESIGKFTLKRLVNPKPFLLIGLSY